MKDVEKIRERLIAFIDNLKRNQDRILSYNEAQARQTIIIPILNILGWDPANLDEVFAEYPIKDGGRVDYSLRLKDSNMNDCNKVFVEVKNPTEDLENHQEQLLLYSFRHSVPLVILTNGMSWWFYLPRVIDEDWDKTKFYTIDIVQQGSCDVASKFIDLISRHNVGSGCAVEAAKSIHTGKVKEDKIKETLPRVWDEIIRGPDEQLCNLIAERTEEKCGFKPDVEVVKRFFERHKDRFIVPNNDDNATQRGSSPSQKSRFGHTNTSGEPRPRGRRGNEMVDDYLIPVIRLIRQGQAHNDAFNQVAKKLGVRYSTVSAQCTRMLHISTDRFVELIRNNEINSFLKRKYPHKVSLIDREL